MSTFAFRLLLPIACATFSTIAQEATEPPTLKQAPLRQPEVSSMTWDVDGVERTALVQIPVPEAGERAPLLFIWHGHGGNSRAAARQFRFNERWPEAILVHPQGLNTPGFTDPEGLRSGWSSKREIEGNRDLAFYDVMLADFIERGIADPDLVYSTGQSNGGGFTYTLLFERGDTLAAIAPASCAASREIRRGLPTPKIPIFHLGAPNDDLVKIAWQQRTIDHFLALHDCEEPEPWGDHPACLIHPSPHGAPVLTYLHTRGHALPKDAGRVFTKFFREHARSVKVERDASVGDSPAAVPAQSPVEETSKTTSVDRP
ncbi:MAG: esterase [Planctomycetota bacterium]|nr:esterase [Planctomycetota bacterium]